MEIEIKDLTCNLKFAQPAGTLYYLKTDYNPFIEESTGISRIETNIDSKVVQLESQRTSCSFTREQYTDLRKGFGIDPSGVIKSTLNNEMNVTEEKIIYNKFLSLGQISEIRNRDKFQSLMNKWFGFVPKTRIKNDSDISIIASKLSASILRKTRIRAGDFLIVNSILGSRIANCQDFVYSDTNSSFNHGITQIGTIRGIKVFVNLYLGYEDFRIVVGASTKEQEPGVYFIEDANGGKIEEFDLPTGRESIMSLTKRMAVAGVGNAEDKFYTLELTSKRHNIFTHLFHKIKGATVSLLNKK